MSDLRRKLDTMDLSPSFLFAFYASTQDDADLYRVLAERFPGVPLVGGTSCSGVMSGKGLGGRHSIGLLGIEDPDGNYGSAAERLGHDAAGAAERALASALDAAGCPGELPELIWIYQTPGHEEAVIEGLRRTVGDGCPIVGGSAADEAVSGEWRQLGPEGPMRDGVVVGVLFSTGGIGLAFRGGYEPAGPSGIVTRIDGERGSESGIVTKARGRRILEIDGQPAAEVYDQWIGGGLAGKIASGGPILADTTMWPLGLDAGSLADVPHYLLVHPEAVTAERGLSTFATIEEGTRLYAMHGDRKRLIDRAGRVAAAALDEVVGAGGRLAGAIVVYCGGCRLAVGDEMPKVASAIAEQLGGSPFLGCFTFGEQGLLLGRNVHGNLMISAVAFGT
ncbi:FIST signal transduction protein [Lutibaculum baratangense]|uniref:FIST signal transduction protein n=1 Tax=Lutibaculum baratangense TaxID=1358440 RepID=UPI001FCAB9B0|nr:FIST N-terminal domain-containing protein [Lutibaculum baratangense]